MVACLFLGLAACRGRVRSIEQLSLALQARGLTVEKVEQTAEEKKTLENFRALIGATPDWEEYQTLRIEGVAVEVTRYSSAFKARSEVNDQLENYANRKKREVDPHRKQDESRYFTNGPFMFQIDHWAVSATPGGKLDMGSYRSLEIDPATEQRIETALKGLKAGGLF